MRTGLIIRVLQLAIFQPSCPDCLLQQRITLLSDHVRLAPFFKSSRGILTDVCFGLLFSPRCINGRSVSSGHMNFFYTHQIISGFVRLASCESIPRINASSGTARESATRSIRCKLLPIGCCSLLTALRVSSFTITYVQFSNQAVALLMKFTDFSNRFNANIILSAYVTRNLQAIGTFLCSSPHFDNFGRL